MGIICIFSVSAAPKSKSKNKLDFDIKLKADTKNGLHYSSKIKSTELELRTEFKIPIEAPKDNNTVWPYSFSFTNPFITIGYAEAGGLMDFLVKPSIVSTSLLKGAGAPLKASGINSANLLGYALGKEAGFFAFVPANPGKNAETAKPVYGLWYDSDSFPFSLSICNSSQPAKNGGPSWYDVPKTATNVVHAAGAWRVWNSKSFKLALAGGLFSSAPAACIYKPEADLGLAFIDGWAIRVESKIKLGRLSWEAIIASTSPSWLGLLARPADAIKLDSELRYLGRGFSLDLGYRYELKSFLPAETDFINRVLSIEVDDEEEEPDFSGKTSIKAGLNVNSILGAFKSSIVLSSVEKQWATKFDNKLNPGLLPFLTLATSWKAENFVSKRFDCFMELDIFKKTGPLKPGLRSELGLSFLPEGSFAKVLLTCNIPTEKIEMGASIAGDGWISIKKGTERPGDIRPVFTAWVYVKL